MRFCIALLLLFATRASAFDVQLADTGTSRLIVNERYEVGEPIIVEYAPNTALAKGDVAIKWQGGDVQFRLMGNRLKRHAWAVPGSHTVTVIVARRGPAPEHALAEPEVYTATFTVGPPPPPAPVEPLNKLVTPEIAAKLALFLRNFAAAPVMVTLNTTAECRTRFTMQAEARELTKNAAWPVILARLEQATPEGAFNATAVRGVLLATADELADKPPAPVDPPGPSPNSPIQYPGFHVLIVEETQSRVNNPPPAGELRNYVKSKGGELRFIDDDQKADLLGEFWQKAFALPRTQVPWVIIAKESQGYSGPWPTSDADRMALLKKYGGQ